MVADRPQRIRQGQARQPDAPEERSCADPFQPVGQFRRFQVDAVGEGVIPDAAQMRRPFRPAQLGATRERPVADFPHMARELDRPQHRLSPERLGADRPHPAVAEHGGNLQVDVRNRRFLRRQGLVRLFFRALPYPVEVGFRGGGVRFGDYGLRQRHDFRHFRAAPVRRVCQTVLLAVLAAACRHERHERGQQNHAGQGPEEFPEFVLSCGFHVYPPGASESESRRQVEARRHRAHRRVGRFAGLGLEALHGRKDQIFEHRDVIRLDDIGRNRDFGHLSVRVAAHRDRTTAAAELHDGRLQVFLHALHLLLHGADLFHHLHNVGHRDSPSNRPVRRYLFQHTQSHPGKQSRRRRPAGCPVRPARHREKFSNEWKIFFQ